MTSLGTLKLDFKLNAAAALKQFKNVSKATSTIQKQSKSLGSTLGSLLPKSFKRTNDALKRMSSESRKTSSTLNTMTRASNGLRNAALGLQAALAPLLIGLAAAGAVLVALGGGALLAARSILKMANETAKVGDEIAKTSQKLGVSVIELQELRYAADRSGVSSESLSTNIRKLNDSIGKAVNGNTRATASFKRIGVSLTDSEGRARKTTDVMEDLADVFKDMKNPVEKAALAQELFGKKGSEMIPMLNSGSAGLRKMREEAQQTGAVMSEKLVRSTEKYKDAQTDLNATKQRFRNIVSEAFLPAITAIMRRLAALGNRLMDAVGDTDEFAQKFEDYMVTAFDNAEARLATFISNLGKGFRSIANFFAQYERTANVLTKAVDFLPWMGAGKTSVKTGAKFTDDLIDAAHTGSGMVKSGATVGQRAAAGFDAGYEAAAAVAKGTVGTGRALKYPAIFGTAREGIGFAATPDAEKAGTGIKSFLYNIFVPTVVKNIQDAHKLSYDQIKKEIQPKMFEMGASPSGMIEATKIMGDISKTEESLDAVMKHYVELQQRFERMKTSTASQEEKDELEREINFIADALDKGGDLLRSQFARLSAAIEGSGISYEEMISSIINDAALKNVLDTGLGTAIVSPLESIATSMENYADRFEKFGRKQRPERPERPERDRRDENEPDVRIGGGGQTRVDRKAARDDAEWKGTTTGMSVVESAKAQARALAEEAEARSRRMRIQQLQIRLIWEERETTRILLNDELQRLQLAERRLDDKHEELVELNRIEKATEDAMKAEMERQAAAERLKKMTEFRIEMLGVEHPLVRLNMEYELRRKQVMHEQLDPLQQRLELMQLEIDHQKNLNDLVKQRTDELREANNEMIEGINIGSKFAGTLTKIMGTTEETDRHLKGATSSLIAATNLGFGIATGNPMQIISGGVDLFSSIVDWIMDVDEEEEDTKADERQERRDQAREFARAFVDEQMKRMGRPVEINVDARGALMGEENEVARRLGNLLQSEMGSRVGSLSFGG